MILDEHLDFQTTASTLSGAGSRALSGVISKFKQFRNVCFDTFTKLYNASVVPVLDYGAGVWGYKKLEVCDKIQQRACRYYLGVHQKAPLHAITGDIGWTSCVIRRHVEMIRLWNRLVNMEDSRITKRIFNWDYELLCNNWSSEVKHIVLKMKLCLILNHLAT